MTTAAQGDIKTAPDNNRDNGVAGDGRENTAVISSHQSELTDGKPLNSSEKHIISQETADNAESTRKASGAPKATATVKGGAKATKADAKTPARAQNQRGRTKGKQG